MKICFLCPSWGNELPFDQFVQKVKAAGYDGVETSLPIDDAALKSRMLDALADAGLIFVGQHWETVTVDFERHQAEYLARLRNLGDGKPLLIDSQTGRDFFSFEQNMALVEVASAFTAETGIPVVHETHRGKFSFAAHVTECFLRANPDLRIGADFSHWCNVAETLLDDQETALSLAISRADHIHARVGFPEGPQVPDPRAEEWADVLAKHLGWWDRIVARARTEGRKTLCITPEFGPYPYMTILPGSKRPIADQWEINVFMMDLLRTRYAGMADS
ncbi:MAG: sugar phosphate isomerase/epimerase [Propionivibrio sp.]